MLRRPLQPGRIELHSIHRCPIHRHATTPLDTTPSDTASPDSGWFEVKRDDAGWCQMVSGGAACYAVFAGQHWGMHSVRRVTERCWLVRGGALGTCFVVVIIGAMCDQVVLDGADVSGWFWVVRLVWSSAEIWRNVRGDAVDDVWLKWCWQCGVALASANLLEFPDHQNPAIVWRFEHKHMLMLTKMCDEMMSPYFAFTRIGIIRIPRIIQRYNAHFLMLK